MLISSIFELQYKYSMECFHPNKLQNEENRVVFHSHLVRKLYEGLGDKNKLVRISFGE